MNQNKALEMARVAMQTFVDAVNSARNADSVQAYTDMKEALSAIDQATKSEDPWNNSPYEVASVVAIWLRSALECKDWHWDPAQKEAATHSLTAFEKLVYGDIPTRATQQEEIYRLHRELAAAKLDAKLGWERAKMHFVAMRRLEDAHDPTNKLCDSDKLRVQWCVDMLTDMKDPDYKHRRSDVLSILGALKRVMQDDIET